MKTCDFTECKKDITDDEHAISICLGGTDQTYDLCLDCAVKVEAFIRGKEK